MIKQVKALAIGGATLDTIIEYEEMFTMNMQEKNHTQSYMLLEEGAKIEVKEHNSFSGGGATNAAVSFVKQNLHVSFFGKVGDDLAGKKILNELNSFGIDTSNVTYSKLYGTATSYVIPTLSGDRTIFAYRGANKDMLNKDLPSKQISESDFIYITSLSKSSAARLPEIVELAAKNNTKVAMNPGSSQLSVGESFIKDSLGGVDILVLNYQEAQKLMVSLLLCDDDDIFESKESLNSASHNQVNSDFVNAAFRLKDFFKTCINLGPRIVVVTDGANGVYAATKNHIYHCEGIKVENVINTLGAGDAFSSTFCASIYKGETVERSMKYALLNASNVIQHSDAKTGLYDMKTLDEKLAEADKNIHTIKQPNNS